MSRRRLNVLAYLAVLVFVAALIGCVWIWGDGNTTDQRSGVGPGMRADAPSITVEHADQVSEESGKILIENGPSPPDKSGDGPEPERGSK